MDTPPGNPDKASTSKRSKRGGGQRKSGDGGDENGKAAPAAGGRGGGAGSSTNTTNTTSSTGGGVPKPQNAPRPASATPSVASTGTQGNQNPRPQQQQRRNNAPRPTPAAQPAQPQAIPSTTSQPVVVAAGSGGRGRGRGGGANASVGFGNNGVGGRGGGRGGSGGSPSSAGRGGSTNSQSGGGGGPAPVHHGGPNHNSQNGGGNHGNRGGRGGGSSSSQQGNRGGGQGQGQQGFSNRGGGRGGAQANRGGDRGGGGGQQGNRGGSSFGAPNDLRRLSGPPLRAEFQTPRPTDNHPQTQNQHQGNNRYQGHRNNASNGSFDHNQRYNAYDEDSARLEAAAAAAEQAARQHKESGGAVPIIRMIPPSTSGGGAQFYFPVGLHGGSNGKQVKVLPNNQEKQPNASEGTAEGASTTTTDKVEQPKTGESKNKKNKKKNKEKEGAQLTTTTTTTTLAERPKQDPRPESSANIDSLAPAEAIRELEAPKAEAPKAEAPRAEAPRAETPATTTSESSHLGYLIRPPALTSAEMTAEITPEVYEGLKELVHPVPILQSYGYTTESPNEHEIAWALSLVTGDETCRRCKAEFKYKEIGHDRISEGECRHHPGKCDLIVEGKRLKNGRPLRLWNCCKQRGFGLGCTKTRTHVVENESAPRLAHLCPFLPTPPASPTRSLNSKIQKVIALDCEMCFTKHGLTLARMTVLSFPGAAVLADIFISEAYPGVPILDYNTIYSGITEEDLFPHNPASKPRVLKGIEAARDKLWEFCDENTIIVGHGLDHDLKCLRVIHKNVVDTAILWSTSLRQKSRLKKLAEMYLGWSIQEDSSVKGPGEKAGHDSIEDCRASMELALEYLRRPPVPKGSAACEIPD
ncbi:hypothetical protein DFH27DRAFT_536370 [Peziza echinospora]|nr:hypothetical protein DFH27DRAFT_536370 [Peziza echinospora]